MSSVKTSNVLPGTLSGSKVEQIVNHLIDGISKGRYVPGQRLVESDLTSELGISRGPLREALRILSAKELLELIPNRGARVKDLKPADIKQRFRLLETLGSLAINDMVYSEIGCFGKKLTDDQSSEKTFSLFSRVINFYGQMARLNHNNLLADYIYKLNLNYFSHHIIMQFDLNTAYLEKHFERVQKAILSGNKNAAQEAHQNWCNQIFTATGLASR